VISFLYAGLGYAVRALLSFGSRHLVVPANRYNWERQAPFSVRGIEVLCSIPCKINKYG
jgi:hypothetical protein